MSGSRGMTSGPRWEWLSCGRPLQAAQHLETVHLRQFKIEQHDFGDGARAVREEVHGFGAVTAHVYLIRQIALLECPQRELGIVRVVSTSRMSTPCGGISRPRLAG